MADQTTEQSFTFCAKKVRHRLLIRKQIEVSPRLEPLIRFLFELIGFNVKLDLILYHGVGPIEGCPVAMGIQRIECDTPTAATTAKSSST